MHLNTADCGELLKTFITHLELFQERQTLHIKAFLKGDFKKCPQIPF